MKGVSSRFYAMKHKAYMENITKMLSNLVITLLTELIKIKFLDKNLKDNN